MNRADMLTRVRDRKRPWDIAVIGGGATGVGVAVDAAARGYAVVLLEQADFGKGTSSRSTKLVHGGVRYLEQGNLSLVLEALRERGLLRLNAPHLVRDLPFIVPTYAWWEGPFYGLGLRVYDFLAGRYGFGRARNLSRKETLRRIPALRTEGLRGGVLYHDGQFDDSRLLIHLARTAAERGAVLVNYAPVTGLMRGSGSFVNGLTARDEETGTELRVPARAVVNATGPFCDAVRRMADPNAEPVIAPSQGAHLVLPRRFLGGDTAIMVPHTCDGRVLFALPWHDHVLVGTTDTPLASAALEPVPTDAEVDFILQTAAGYLEHPPARCDVLSTFAGVRPLVAPGGKAASTARLSRDHHVEIDQAGVVTVAGGKWTTYRRMAEDAVDHAALLARLEERPCVTRGLRIHGYHETAEEFGELACYGADAPAVQALAARSPALAEKLHPELPYLAAEVVWAARWEMARTVEDVLARRTRALFLNAPAALAMAPKVAALLAAELGRVPGWREQQVRSFTELARGYLVA
jgi:glycerol-3-phosphate dehydrogenase